MSDIAERLNAELHGRYVVGRHVGAGGMAIVVKARDLRHDRWVAIKVLRPELAPTLGSERFLREIRLAAGLHHPHILPVHDSGEADGLLFYVMPFVEGESLRQKIENEGQLAIDDALRIAHEVADALHHAHGRDVVHRDIKPENLLITAGHALVADFGIARAISAAGGMRLTEIGVTVGTPAYMAPEQADAREVDGRTDVYALGCVLYEMLAGKPPYEARGYHAALAAHIGSPIPRISALRPSVPDAVEAAIVRALAKNPADRFQTAADFAAALPANTTMSQAAMSPTRRRHMAAMQGLLVLGVLGAGTWAAKRAWTRTSSPTPVTIAVAPIAVSDSSDAPFAVGLTQEVTSALTRVPGIAPRPYATVSAEARAQSNPLDLGRRLGVDYVMAGSLRRVNGRLLLSTELIRLKDGTNVWSPRTFQGTESEFSLMQDSVAARLVREFAGNFAPLRHPRREPDPESYKLYLQARATPLVDAAGSQHARALLVAAVTRDSLFSDAWAALSQTYNFISQMSGDPPGEVVRLQMEAANRAIALDSLNGEAWLSLAQLYWVNWDMERSESYFRKALLSTPNFGTLRTYHGVFLHLIGQPDSAIAEVRRGIELDPTNPHLLAILAYQLLTAGRLREADSAAVAAIAMRPGSWVPHFMRGRIATKERRFADALRHCQEIERLQGAANPFAFTNAGQCYARAGDTVNARRVIRTLTQLGEKRYVERAFFALLYNALGDREAAMRELELSAGIHERDFLLALRYGADVLWAETRYQALLRRTTMDRFWKTPPPN
jgi:serine/threonine protein kinase/tetratricopeptide (TPR) repeat protein